MRGRTCVTTALGLLLLTSPGVAQTERIVRGQVVAAGNGEALARVRVDGPGDPRTFPDVLTDDGGQFTLRVAGDATLRLRLSKAGFATVTMMLSARDAATPLRVPMEPGAAISGRIVSTSGVPVRSRVFVHPDTPGTVEPASAYTDDLGEFRVGGLLQGRYIVTTAGGSTWTVRVTPDGERQWVPYEARLGGMPLPPRPEGNVRRVITARAGEETPGADFILDVSPPTFGDVSLPLSPRDQSLPPGVLSGTVVDERGEPMAGVVVRAQHLRTVNGRTVALTATDPVETDDRGRFRVFGLRPGEYVVSALVNAQLGGPRQYTVTYAGGAFDLEAATRWQVLEAEVGGIAIAMDPVELFSISGTVVPSSGAVSGGSVRLALTHRSGRPIPEPRSLPLGPDGRFTFAGLPAGDYAVQATTGGTLGTPAEFGVAFAPVGDGRPVSLVIRTVEPAVLSGRVIVEGAADDPPTALTLRVLPDDPDRSLVNQSGVASLTTQSDGTFYVTRLAGRNRIVLGSAPDGWFMKELLLGGSDVAAEPFDFGAGGGRFDDAVLVMSRRGAVIAGRAEAERDGPMPPYWVVVFPTDSGDRISRSQFIKYAPAEADGTFRVTSLPPGGYHVAAVRTLTPPAGIDEWPPADLDRLATLATRVTIAEGETRTVRPRLHAR